jgi:hypothetical protein
LRILHNKMPSALTNHVVPEIGTSGLLSTALEELIESLYLQTGLDQEAIAFLQGAGR